MMSLKSSKLFQDDYARYQRQIFEIKDETVKKELTNLLVELSNCVISIDMHHDTLLSTGRLPEATNDIRNNLASIKRKLDTRLMTHQRFNK